MCNMLAAGRHGEPTGAAPAKLSLADVVALAPLLPLNTAFQLLTKPLLDRGIGLRLKRARSLVSSSSVDSTVGVQARGRMFFVCDQCPPTIDAGATAA